MAVSSIVNRGMVNEGIADATALATARTVGVVESAMTLNVPSDFATLQEAMDWIEARVLVAEVTVQIADGTYEISASQQFSHPNYALVNILGNASTPSNVTYNVTGSIYAFFVNKSRLKELRGIKIVGGQFGIFSAYGSFMYVRDCECWDQSYMSIGCYYGSVLQAHDTIADNAAVAHGFHSSHSSFIYTTNPTSRNNAQWGFGCNNMASIKVGGTVTASGNSSGTYMQTLNASPDSQGCIIRND